MTLFSVVVTPVLAQALPEAMAERVRRAVLPRYHLWVLASAAAGAVALYPLSKPDAGLLAAVAGLAFWARRVLLPRIDALADAAGPGGAAAAHGLARAQRLARAASLLQMVAAAVVLAGFVF
jgi:hypothetical protein